MMLGLRFSGLDLLHWRDHGQIGVVMGLLLLLGKRQEGLPDEVEGLSHYI